MNGPLYANEFFKISRLAYGNVTKLVDVEFLVSLYCSYFVAESNAIRDIGRSHATNTFKYSECHKIISSFNYIHPF